ncbi:MAG: hypothetical protein RR370_03150 [Synergistaceae bacterium]
MKKLYIAAGVVITVIIALLVSLGYYFTALFIVAYVLGFLFMKDKV